MSRWLLVLLAACALCNLAHGLIASKDKDLVTPAPRLPPLLKEAKKRLFGFTKLKPTKEDVLRRMSPDTYDNSSDEDTSDPIATMPYDAEYIKYLIKHPKEIVDQETIRYWRNEAKVNRFNKFDDTW